VLVVGGGMAAAWAALAAAEAGASVIVVDKGAMGTSGVTATGGPGHWFVPPEGREAAITRQIARTEELAQADWMARVLDLTWRYLPTIAPWYPFGSDGRGGRYVRACAAPNTCARCAGCAQSPGSPFSITIPRSNCLLARTARSSARVGWPWPAARIGKSVPALRCWRPAAARSDPA
jgi:glycine/D-amino acid oxidase-like deaminating enzyme